MYIVIDPDGSPMPNTMSSSPNKAINTLLEQINEEIETEELNLFDFGYRVKELDFNSEEAMETNPIPPEVFEQAYESQTVKG